MTQLNPEYRARQDRQLERYLQWTRTQPDAVGHELPTRLTTIFSENQLMRMNWLKSNTTGEVLEVGCNFGAVLAWVGGSTGLDINPNNIELARLLSPDRKFDVGDAAVLPYGDQSFDTVLLPEILEHLSWPAGVDLAVAEACRVARRRVLITMPDGETDSHSPEAESFKHQFLADRDHVADLTRMFPMKARVTTTWNFGFVLIRAALP